MSERFENAAALISARHSVRAYLDRPIPEEIRRALDAFTAALNEESGLCMQILYDEPACFGTRMAYYGRFRNCANYISLVGKKSKDLDERCGFYGELLVLKAQELGLNTCWAALTHGKSKAKIGEDEKEAIVIALGYGQTQGNARKSKAPEDVSNIGGASPEWFKRGVQSALLAPTAVNQQKFRLIFKDGKVKARAGKTGYCLKIDLGIVKCHFELAAGKENFTWA